MKNTNPKHNRRLTTRRLVMLFVEEAVTPKKGQVVHASALYGMYCKRASQLGSGDFKRAILRHLRKKQLPRSFGMACRLFRRPSIHQRSHTMKNATNKVTLPRSGNQPGQSSTLKIYGANTIPTIRVRSKGSDDDRELTINQSDFDPDCYVRSD